MLQAVVAIVEASETGTLQQLSTKPHPTGYLSLPSQRLCSEAFDLQSLLCEQRFRRPRDLQELSLREACTLRRPELGPTREQLLVRRLAGSACLLERIKRHQTSSPQQVAKGPKTDRTRFGIGSLSADRHRTQRPRQSCGRWSLRKYLPLQLGRWTLQQKADALCVRVE
jgi:hypothetical protein